MKRKLLFAAMLIASAWVHTYAIDWTDKTSLITNPSFETDDAISDLTACGWASDRVTGWTIAPSSSSSAQIGIGNSSSKIQGIGSSFSPAAGDKYFFTRNNWNKTTNYSFTQEIVRNGENLPAGLYKLTCKAATFSSDAAFGSLTLGLKEGAGSTVTHDGIVLNVWNTWGVIIYKKANDTNLTIEVKFNPGYDGNGKHYALLMDDFHLEYISEDDAFAASSTSTIDFSDIINNAGVYNHSTKGNMPRGWTSYKHTTGNGNYTEGEKGDTRFEGWSGGNLDIDYYQQITNLPAGTYTVTAAAQERAEVGRTYVYAYTDGQEKATGLVNSATETDITTSALKVTNGTMNIGIESTANDWVTADNFRISFLGFDVDAVKANYEASYNNATAAKDAKENENIVGTERTTFEGVISTYTTVETQSYKWYVIAKEALDNAIDAFVAARTNYDALVAEIAKAKALGIADATANSYAANSSSTAATALTKTQDLKVAEYNYVTTTYQYGVKLGSWTTTGPTGSLSEQHYKGAGNEYLEQSSAAWGQSAWEIKYAQDVTLPAGNYVFKVAGRQAASDGVTLGLTVKNGETVIGTVSDFPRGDTGLGINTTGATDFTTGEGHEYVNGGAGRGWEWRYVKFTLAEGATVNVAVEAKATIAHMWVSFCDATVQTDTEANISLIAYNIALNNANVAIANGDYANVTGSENTDLQAAIDADGTLDKSNKTAIDAAKDNLDAKTKAFTDAKSAYDAYVAAKAEVYPTLAYAATANRTALDDAQGTADATSASDAATKTAAILTAARQYYESHALAEGVTGAENKTDLIADPNFAGIKVEGTTAGGWNFDQTGGNAQVTAAESFTDGSGNSSYNYFDYFNGSNNNQNIHQTIENLAPGHYMLTATGRGHANFNDNLQIYVVGKGDTKIPAIGSTGGVFDRGWNDASLEFYQTEIGNITIGAKTNNNKGQWWGVTRFRLVRLGDAVENVSVTAAGLATYVSDVDLDYSEVSGLKAYKATVSGTTATFTPVTTVPAGEGVLLEGAEGTYSVPMTSGIAAWADEDNAFIPGTGAAVETGEGDVKSYILSTDNDGSNVGFYFANGETVPTNRAYLQSTADAGARLTLEFEGGEANGIDSLENGKSNIENAAIYNLAGQRVKKAQKGLYIIGGKTVLVK